MKFEKINENKIKIIMKQDDFKDKTIDLKNLIISTPESQVLFLEILNKAEKEINFYTDGCKLLIDTYFESDNICILTITKYNESNKSINNKKKILNVKKKNYITDNYFLIYQFEQFEDFCNLCEHLDKNNKINIRKCFKYSILYFYNSTYFLVVDISALNLNDINKFHSLLLEFSNLKKSSNIFYFKLLEYGKVIAKGNVINFGIKYFSK